MLADHAPKLWMLYTFASDPSKVLKMFLCNCTFFSRMRDLIALRNFNIVSALPRKTTKCFTKSPSKISNHRHAFREVSLNGTSTSAET